MDALDKKILTVINRSIPLEERPFKAVADRVGISEGEVIRRIAGLKAAGIIRRIGGVINPRGLGWHSTLCAASVPEDRIEDYAEVVNAYPEVTHNYVRTGDPNCWFTLIAANEERSKEIIREIEERLRIKILDLPAKRIFKIKVSFNL
ncbi:MAG TPA: AsnC family transcriptional regulator [Deltaproteobacteria bacterium]|nr:AsnC family transcriptional regulator [Deltaproteobacteria bacterium]